MRLNRNTRIGLLLIGAALILMLVVKMFQGLTAAPPVVAVDDTANTAVPTETVSTSGMTIGANVEIPERSIITRDMLRLIALPSNGDDAAALPYITSEIDAVGFVTNKRILPGQRLTKSDLVGHFTTVGISGLLRPGFRAQIIPIPGKNTLHDLVAVGDFIDIIASFEGQEARTIAQNVRVLAVDVFAKDFPASFKAARRGDYKAEPVGAGFAAPPTPPGAAPAPAPAGATPAPAAGAPAPAAAPGPAPTPTPAPDGPPPAKPDPALTVEVTPDQAAAIALAQNATAALDYVLRPRPAVTTVGPVRVVSITKNRLAPYADRKRSAGGAGGNANARGGGSGQTRVASSSGGGRGGYDSSFTPPPLPPTNMVPPAPVTGVTSAPGAPAAPETYQIPIYGDGKVTRYDTVRKPE